jgi:hypothetical protein
LKSGELLSNLYRLLQEYVTPWTYKLFIQASLVFQIKPIHCQHMVSLLFSLSQVLKTISNDQSEVQPEAVVPSFMLLPFQGYQFPICCWYKLVRIVLPLSMRSSYQWSDLAMIFYDHYDHMNWSKAISNWAVQIIDLWKHIQLHSVKWPNKVISEANHLTWGLKPGLNLELELVTIPNETVNLIT